MQKNENKLGKLGKEMEDQPQSTNWIGEERIIHEDGVA